jgi:hypothetical protein
MTNFAQGNSLGREVYKAPIASVDFQEHSALSRSQLQRGSISVNLGQRQVSLVLALSSDCPSGVFCDAILQQWKVSLPLRSAYTGPCGLKIFKASTLLGSMSTSYQELLIMDYSNYRCNVKRMSFATKIEFKQIDFSPSIPNSTQQRLTLKASELRLTF